MMMLSLTSIALAIFVGTQTNTHVPAQVAPPRFVLQDSLLTEDVLKRLTLFWTRYVKEPDSIQTAGAKALSSTLHLHAAGYQDDFAYNDIVDMIKMAQKYPSVAEDLKQAGLTAYQFEQYRNAIIVATVTANLASYSVASNGPVNKLAQAPPATTVVGKNMAFVHTHAEQLTKLAQAGSGMVPMPPFGF